jgi:thioredoxin reductase (NADPH)
MFDSRLLHACDVAVVGAGPAGLAAAVYLSRFLRSVVVLDAGDSRAKLIPRSRNCPGFPQGIAGEELLTRLREQAKAYGTCIVEACVDNVEKADGSFILTTTAGVTQASRAVLATGVVDKAPAIAGLREAIAGGIVRLCPVCDAYEAAGQRIGVVGPERLALSEALFLRHYSPHVCLISNHREDVSENTRMRASAAGIGVWDVVDELIVRDSGFDVIMGDGLRQLDVVYPAMGCDVRSELAINLGADCDEEGYILVGSHLETSVSGLYAIGDVAKALNQIAVGFGHAALAATHIHNNLREHLMPTTQGHQLELARPCPGRGS